MYWKSDPMFVCRLEDKDLPALGGPSEKVSGRAPLPGAGRDPGCVLRGRRRFRLSPLGSLGLRSADELRLPP